MSSLNFSADAFESSGSYSPVPAGTYNTTIYEVKIVQVKSGENACKDQFNVQFRIADGQYENRRLFTYIPLYAGKAQWKTLAFFKALGFEPKPNEPFQIPTPADLGGKPIGVKVTVVQDQNGGDDNNVAGFSSLKVSDAVANLASVLGAKPVTGGDPFGDIF
jgi:hypothetical protein